MKYLLIPVVLALFLSGCATFRTAPAKSDPETVARDFIANSAKDPGYARADLMSDCRGEALVYVTTEDVKYRVNLIFDRDRRAWKVRSASAFGEDELN